MTRFVTIEVLCQVKDYFSELYLYVPSWVRLRNKMMLTAVEIVHFVKKDVREHLCVDGSISNPTVSFELYENPFDCTFVLSNHLYILPNWFSFVNEHDDEVYSDDSDDMYKMQLRDNILQITKGTDVATYSTVDERYLEMRLEGIDGSLFKHHYPLGIELKNCIPNTESKGKTKLYQLLPFLLYLSLDWRKGGKYIPYEKESFKLTMLEDDTFDVREITWNDVV